MKKVGIHNFTMQFTLAGFWIEPRKVGIQDLPSKIHFLQLFGKETLKGMLAEKSWNSQFYYPKLTAVSFWIDSMKRKGTKKSQNLAIQSPKFILAAVWQGNFERNNWN